MFDVPEDLIPLFNEPGRYHEPSLLCLPDEILLKIATHLSQEDLLRLGLVNRRLNVIASGTLKEFNFQTSGSVEERMMTLWSRRQALPYESRSWYHPFSLLASTFSFMCALASFILARIWWKTNPTVNGKPTPTPTRSIARNIGSLSPMTFSFLGCEFTPERKMHTCLRRFPRISSLKVSRTLATGEALSSLKHMQRLKKLTAENCVITPSTLPHISVLVNLTVLHLKGSCLSGSLAQLNTLVRLQVLSLGDCFLTDADIESITPMSKHLAELDVSENFLTTAQTLRPFNRLRRLNLGYMSTLRSGWEGLAALTGLTHLVIASTGADDNALLHVGELGNIRTLCASNSPLRDASVRTIAEKFPLIEELDLSGCDVSDAVTGTLAAMPKLKKLDLSSTLITDEGLAAFCRHPHIQQLALSAYLGRMSVTNAGLRHVATMTSLEELAVDCCHITDGAIRALTSLPRLKGLNVTDCYMVTDKSIRHLASYPSLHTVCVSGTGMTRAGRWRLRSSLRNGAQVNEHECVKLSFQTCSVVSNHDLQGQVWRAVVPSSPAGPAGRIAGW